jgi:hypothetical protein
MTDSINGSTNSQNPFTSQIDPKTYNDFEKLM